MLAPPLLLKAALTMADHLVSKRAPLDSTHPTRILARSMYKRLLSEGYDERQIVAFATEIIASLAASLQARGGRQAPLSVNDADEDAGPALDEVSPAFATTDAQGNAGWTTLNRASRVIALSVLVLVAPGCSESNGGDIGSCIALCVNQSMCLQPNAQACVTTCTQQESQCANSNHSAEFQAFLDCASRLSGSASTCGHQGPQTAQCAEQALKLLECGVAKGEGPDGGTPDAPTTNGNTRDPIIPFYDGGTAAVTPCYADKPFSEIPWAPPTPLHQDRCTARQIGTYINTLNGDGPFTSGSTSCDACLQTEVGAASHGPMVATGLGTVSAPIETNWGGCIANLDGTTGTASCGNALNHARDCLIAQCGACTDASWGGPTTRACTMLALDAGGRCAKETTTAECAAEIETGGIAAACGPTLTSLLTIWCGP